MTHRRDPEAVYAATFDMMRFLWHPAIAAIEAHLYLKRVDAWWRRRAG